uniref:Uncharacterized protein n=1 Tax=Anopheles atroparvus TaxID=41427 RepID=A0A182JDQ3_ANOAO
MRTTKTTTVVTTVPTSIDSTTTTTTPAISTYPTESYPVTLTSVVTTTPSSSTYPTTPSTFPVTTRDTSSTVYATPAALSSSTEGSSLPVSKFPSSTPATTTPTTTELPVSLPTTLPVSTAANESIALWIALSGIFIVLFTLASAYALYVYVAGIEIHRALGGIGSFLTCRRPSRTKRTNEHDHVTPGGPNNFDPNDTYYHHQMQHQLKNRLRPMHTSVSSISNNSSKAIRQKYPRASMDSYQLAGIGAGKALPFGQPRLELMDDIDIIKYKNRLNQL